MQSLRSWASDLMTQRVQEPKPTPRPGRGGARNVGKRKRFEFVANPWKLTPHQVASIEAVIAHCSSEKAATALHMSPKTISTHLTRSKQKMGTENLLATVLTFDRWNRTRA